MSWGKAWCTPCGFDHAGDCPPKVRCKACGDTGMLASNSRANPVATPCWYCNGGPCRFEGCDQSRPKRCGGKEVIYDPLPDGKTQARPCHGCKDCIDARCAATVRALTVAACPHGYTWWCPEAARARAQRGGE